MTITGKTCPNCTKPCNWIRIDQGKVFCNSYQFRNAPIDWFSVVVGLLTISILAMLVWYLPQILVSLWYLGDRIRQGY